MMSTENEKPCDHKASSQKTRHWLIANNYAISVERSDANFDKMREIDERRDIVSQTNDHVDKEATIDAVDAIADGQVDNKSGGKRPSLTRRKCVRYVNKASRSISVDSIDELNDRYTKDTLHKSYSADQSRAPVCDSSTNGTGEKLEDVHIEDIFKRKKSSLNRQKCYRYSKTKQLSVESIEAPDKYEKKTLIKSYSLGQTEVSVPDDWKMSKSMSTSNIPKKFDLVDKSRRKAIRLVKKPAGAVFARRTSTFDEIMGEDDDPSDLYESCDFVSPISVIQIERNKREVSNDSDTSVFNCELSNEDEEDEDYEQLYCTIEDDYLWPIDGSLDTDDTASYYLNESLRHSLKYVENIEFLDNSDSLQGNQYESYKGDDLLYCRLGPVKESSEALYQSLLPLDDASIYHDQNSDPVLYYELKPEKGNDNISSDDDNEKSLYREPSSITGTTEPSHQSLTSTFEEDDVKKVNE